MLKKVLKTNTKEGKSDPGSFIKHILFNPFYIYSLTVVIALFFYALKWSNLPQLSFTTQILFIGTAVLSFLIGTNVKRLNIKQEKKEPALLWRLSLLLSIILSVGFIAIYIHGGIPFFNILFSSENYNYQDFKGIRYISTVVMYGYSSLLCIWVNAWWRYRNKYYLVLIAVGFIHVILMASRGYTMLILFPSILITVYFIRFKIKYIFPTGLAAILLLYLFGMFGDHRESAKDRDGSWNFYQEYKGENFPKNLPEEYLWSYFYFTSPIGKFQYTTEDDSVKMLPANYCAFTIHQLIPYSFGNRINKITQFDERKSSYGYPRWFVGTAFMGPFMYGKWVGVMIYVVIMFVYVFFIYQLGINKLGPWSFPVLANLSMFMLLSIFDNMMVFAPINFQIWGLISFGFLINRKNIRLW